METELTALRRDVAYLMDRTQIMDCIAAHARGDLPGPHAQHHYSQL